VAGRRARLCCTRCPSHTRIDPSSILVGIDTISWRLGLRRTSCSHGSSFRASAAVLNWAWAISNGLRVSLTAAMAMVCLCLLGTDPGPGRPVAPVKSPRRTRNAGPEAASVLPQGPEVFQVRSAFQRQIGLLADRLPGQSAQRGAIEVIAGVLEDLPRVDAPPGLPGLDGGPGHRRGHFRGASEVE